MGVLEGKSAIVTGAGRGVGRAVARLFAREGARVLVNDLGCDRAGEGADPAVARSVAEEIGAEGGTAIANHESCATAAGAERVVAAGIEAFGRVDTLVYAAGILADQPLLRMDAATVQRVLDVHVMGACFATRAAAASMRATGGRIVLTTGAAGLLGNFGQPAYSAAAAATYGLMRAASIELQRHAIFVNAIAPMAKTRLTADLPMFEHVETMTADHVAPAYLFLGSDLATDLTGNVVAMAGGRISLYKLTESSGRFKDAEAGVWTAEEIRDEWSAMARP
jgi:NAD(P)-dependent dehydrogenase (short-subunit alcohol dehydrogenase family)